MKQYHDMLEYILANGVESEDRTGTGTISVFGYQNRYDLSKGFPLVTTKRVHWKSVVVELLWFLRGDTNVKWLNDNGCTIWDEWADYNGDLGPVYGKQWRDWSTWTWLPDDTWFIEPKGFIDQIANVIEQIKTNPNDRGIIVSAWNVAELEEMALRPCHCLFQFYVRNGKLSCQLYQRSADAFLGVPFNIASYALLTHMIAQVCDLKVGEFVHTFGDLHIYKNHLEQVKLQLTREPRPLPLLVLNGAIKDIDDFALDDIMISGYDPHPAIKGEVAV